MHRLLIAICISIFPTFLFSQIDTFNIASYARPDLRRSIAIVEPYFSFNSTTGARENSTFNKNFSLNLGGSYLRTDFFNTDTTQITTRYGGSLHLGFRKNNGVNISSNSIKDYFNLSPNFLIRHRKKAFKEDQRFFETNYSANIDLDALNFEKGNADEISRILIDGYGSAAFFWGKGRIELVNDAWHALTILEMLEAADLLIKPMSQSDIKALADKIASIKNFRNTDFRLELISEYEALCSYFLENGIVNKEDYRFFAHLNDAWQYESFINRSSGKEWKFGINPILEIQSLNDGGFFFDIDNITDESAFLYEGTLYGTISYRHYQAVSLDWQKNFLFQMDVGPSFYRTSGEISFPEYYKDRIDLNAILSTDYIINYVPNARTYYQLSFDASYRFISRTGGNFNDFKSGYLNAGINGRFRKYISPQLSWSIDGRMNFNSEQFDFKGHTNYSYLRAGIIYRFF